jgi:hypothetical protein
LVGFGAKWPLAGFSPRCGSKQSEQSTLITSARRGITTG